MFNSTRKLLSRLVDERIARTFPASEPAPVTPPPEAEYIPTPSDWQEYCEWLDSLPQSRPVPPRDLTDAEWREHVKQYLADHGLSQPPF